MKVRGKKWQKMRPDREQGPNPRLGLVCSSMRSWDFMVFKQRGLSEEPR